MSEIHQVIFYPVGNGDTTQIILSAGRRVLFDFCHRDSAEDDDTPEIDLKARLKEDLKAANRDYFDVVAFTHADLDHIQGSTDFFELQHAKKYQGEGRIKIRELWVPAAMLLEEADNGHQVEECILLRQEARHRLLEGKDILVF
jgi:glyoxylase-like metal-dependent hydrolase (beta-lactamase superfamily II)